MIVYRVQDDEGRGPYKPGLSKYWVVSRPDHDYLLPWTASVTRKQLADWFSRYRCLGCGCTSIDDLRRWIIRPEYETLRALGYNAVRLDVDAILWRDETQVVFGRNKPLRRGARFVELWAPALLAAQEG